jgi:N-acetylneuraminate synthase
MSYDFNDLFIFEMANNHQGEVSHGLRIVEEMARIQRRFGIKAAVKLQYRDLDTFIHPDHKEGSTNKHIPRFLQTRLQPAEFCDLVLAIRESGMLTVVTPFDEPSVEVCLNHGVDVLKVASCSANDWPLLEEIASARKPVICSTGGCTLRDIDKVANFMEHRGVKDMALLHCVGVYPTLPAQANLQFMKRMMARYAQYAVGHSGHEAPDELSIIRAAVAMGARIFERHVGVATDTIKLNAYSMNPEQAARWVEAALEAKAILGPEAADKQLGESEVQSLRSLMRGVFARGPISAGEQLTRDKVFFAMPCQEGQTLTRDYLETMPAGRDYETGAAIFERRLANPIHDVRSVIHEAKGLLREAHIVIGNEFTVELSHHFGIQNFRRVGATIVNLINREYCKKLIILLPGQTHPGHYHAKKEETFQVLHGDMELELEGKKMLLSPGDIVLVKRNEMHSFATVRGLVFEEISTTHHVGDSYYQDPKIAQLDPMQRKTLLETW